MRYTIITALIIRQLSIFCAIKLLRIMTSDMLDSKNFANIYHR